MITKVTVTAHFLDDKKAEAFIKTIERYGLVDDIFEAVGIGGGASIDKEQIMELCINCEQPLNKEGTCDICNLDMPYPIATTQG